MDIKIKNLRQENIWYPYQVRVDRKTIFGNPFPMKNESKRDEVCDKYAEYFKTRMNKKDAFAAEIVKLVHIFERYGKLELFCWCAPKRCHAETIKEYIESEVITKVK